MPNNSEALTLGGRDIYSRYPALLTDLGERISTVESHARAVVYLTGGASQGREYEKGYYDGLIQALALILNLDAKAVALRVANAT